MLGALQQLAAAAMENNYRLDPATLLLQHQLFKSESSMAPTSLQSQASTTTASTSPPTPPSPQQPTSSSSSVSSVKIKDAPSVKEERSDTPESRAESAASEAKEETTVKSEDEEMETGEGRLQIVAFEPRPNIQEFQAGAKFGSFAEFEAAFEAWKAANYHPFRVASSETLRMPDGSANELFKYRYIVYHCAHYGAPRMRGAGKRPNQNYLPCGCRAMLRLNFGWADNALRITTLNDRHTGHDVSAENFYKFKVKVRRPSATPPPRTPSGQSRRTPSVAPLVAPSPTAMASPATTPKAANPLAVSNLAALSLAASFVQSQPLATSMESPVSATSDQENENPLDLRLERDGRSDEERFAEMHASLQALTDHLLACRGPDFDSKLRQLRIILRSWDLHKA